MSNVSELAGSTPSGVGMLLLVFLDRDRFARRTPERPGGERDEHARGPKTEHASECVFKPCHYRIHDGFSPVDAVCRPTAYILSDFAVSAGARSPWTLWPSIVRWRIEEGPPAAALDAPATCTAPPSANPPSVMLLSACITSM